MNRNIVTQQITDTLLHVCFFSFSTRVSHLISDFPIINYLRALYSVPSLVSALLQPRLYYESVLDQLHNCFSTSIGSLVAPATVPVVVNGPGMPNELLFNSDPCFADRTKANPTMQHISIHSMSPSIGLSLHILSDNTQGLNPFTTRQSWAQLDSTLHYSQCLVRIWL